MASIARILSAQERRCKESRTAVPTSAKMCPHAIPPTVTLYEAAAQPETMRFTLWGAVIALPIVIAYIVYS